jgi:homoserine/homoserine lactone efflux protein
MTWETYWLYLALVAAFFATPPDTSQLLIITNSIQYGVKRSVLTIFGDLSANVLQMTAAAFGLAAIIATSASLFQVIKWAGVAYLLWIGIQLYRSSSRQAEAGSGKQRSDFSLFRQGFITSSANPYAVVFFAALFPQFIDPAHATLPQLAVLGGTYILVDGIILLLWGWFAVHAVQRIKVLTSGLINKACGLLMIGAALLLAIKGFDRS